MSETHVTTEVQFENSDDLDAFSAGFFGQKQPETTETKVETEQEQEPQASENTETQTEDDKQDEAELQQPVDEKPKRKTVQDRIDEVVRQREDIRREAAAEQAKLLARIEALEKGNQPAPVQQQEAKEPDPNAMKEDGVTPLYQLGEFDPQYIRDLTRFELGKERERMHAEIAETQRQTGAQQEQQTLQASWNTKAAEVAKQHADFEEKGRNLLQSFNHLDAGYANYLGGLILGMEKGPEVLYYLSNHPDEATAIVNSGATKATLALGRIESRFMQGEQPVTQTRVTQAPPPPVARARGSNGAFISVAPDTDDLAAFEREFFKR